MCVEDSDLNPMQINVKHHARENIETWFSNPEMDVERMRVPVV